MSHIAAAAIRPTDLSPTKMRRPIACGSGIAPMLILPNQPSRRKYDGLDLRDVPCPGHGARPDPRHPDWSKCRDASLVTGFGRDELPVGIPRSHVARERPNVRDVSDFFRAAVNHVSVAVAGHRDELRHEADGHLCGTGAQLGPNDVGFVDGHEPGLSLLALGLAIPDRSLEAVIDLAREQVLEGAPIALRVGGHNHLVGRAG